MCERTHSLVQPPWLDAHWMGAGQSVYERLVGLNSRAMRHKAEWPQAKMMGGRLTHCVPIVQFTCSTTSSAG